MGGKLYKATVTTSRFFKTGERDVKRLEDIGWEVVKTGVLDDGLDYQSTIAIAPVDDPESLSQADLDKHIYEQSDEYLESDETVVEFFENDTSDDEY